MHLFKFHMWDTVIIVEDGPHPHPRFPFCGMLVPWTSLNYRHPSTAQCAKGEEWKRLRLVTEEDQSGT